MDRAPSSDAAIPSGQVEAALGTCGDSESGCESRTVVEVGGSCSSDHLTGACVPKALYSWT